VLVGAQTRALTITLPTQSKHDSSCLISDTEFQGASASPVSLFYDSGVVDEWATSYPPFSVRLRLYGICAVCVLVQEDGHMVWQERPAKIDLSWIARDRRELARRRRGYWWRVPVDIITLPAQLVWGIVGTAVVLSGNE